MFDGAAHIAILVVAIEPAVLVAKARHVADQGRAPHRLASNLGTAQDEAVVELPKQFRAPVQQHVVDGVGAGDQAFAARSAIRKLSMATIPTSPLGSVWAV